MCLYHNDCKIVAAWLAVTPYRCTAMQLLHLILHQTQWPCVVSCHVNQAQCVCHAGNANAVAQAIAQAGTSSNSGDAGSTASAVAQAVSQASVPAPVQSSAFAQAIAQTLGSGNAQASATAIAAALSSNQAGAVSQAFSQVIYTTHSVHTYRHMDDMFQAQMVFCMLYRKTRFDHAWDRACLPMLNTEQYVSSSWVSVG